MLPAELSDPGCVSKSEEPRHLVVLPLCTSQFPSLGSQYPDQGRNCIAQHSDLTTQMFAIATLIEPFMKLLVQSRVVVKPLVTGDGRIEHVDEAIDLIGVKRRPPLGRQLPSAALEHRTHFKDVFDFVRFQRYNIKTTTWFKFDEPLCRKAI